MNEITKDLIIIGGGPAGMCAAISAYDSGVRDILIIERDPQLGGILRQCIHSGFGLHRYGEELTGPEYASKCLSALKERNISYKTEATVLEISPQKVLTVMSASDGIFHIKAKAIILAMGCRERPRGALNISGERPAGIYSAGMAQKLVNMKGYLPGKNVVILGSGDIGLIMARRMTLEGAKVHAVCEIMPYSGGLARNIEQCLNDFNIPLMLSHTVKEIHGKRRIEGVTVVKVDKKMKPIEGTEQYIACDTLLLSVGLIPENELSLSCGLSLNSITKGVSVDQDRQTEINGIFSCGNVLHVHDLADYASEEAEIAGKASADYIEGRLTASTHIEFIPDGKIRYTVPMRITKKKDVTVYFRVSQVFRDKNVVIRSADRVLYKKKHIKLVPGEMESVTLKADMLENCEKIHIGIE